MKLISTYDRIKAADGRCKEIVEELRKLPPMEYCVEYQRLQTRGLLSTVTVNVSVSEEYT